MSEPEQQPRQQQQASLPRVTIEFCTQCKWMLRAAYYAQELLSTFGLALGEVALRPSTGGVFIVRIAAAMAEGPMQSPQHERVLWDRRSDGGFPETKELKRRVRDVVEPRRHLGHIDRDHERPRPPPPAPASSAATAEENCEDCR